MIGEGHDLAVEPWSEVCDLLITVPGSKDTSKQVLLQIVAWALRHQHYALVAIALKELVARVPREGRWAVDQIIIMESIAIPACERNAKMFSIVLDILLDATQKHELLGGLTAPLLVAASKTGRVEVVKLEEMEVRLDKLRCQYPISTTMVVMRNEDGFHCMFTRA
jgi:hypothetical protein